jgi:hypothetical protein
MKSSRQVCSTECGLAYAMVVAGHAVPQQPSGPHNSPAKGSDHSEPATSCEAASSHMSHGDLSGLLCGMLDGNTKCPSGSRRQATNKNHIYVSGDTDTHCFFLIVDTGLVSVDFEGKEADACPTNC